MKYGLLKRGFLAGSIWYFLCAIINLIAVGPNSGSTTIIYCGFALFSFAVYAIIKTIEDKK